MAPQRSSQVLTFLFTDIEGSTARWESDAEKMREELEAHDDVLRAAIESNGGRLFKHTGDGVCAAFTSPHDAVAAAVDAQRAIALPVRMGIATGEVHERGDDYFGPVMNRVARVMDAGHGGQILVTASTAALVEETRFLPHGPRRLRDLSQPIEIFQVQVQGLRNEFPPLRTMDVVPGNLPTQATSFVGRDEQIGQLIDAIRAHRLVTLVGVGGVGKTRLALQAAAQIADDCRDGAWLIELAPVFDGAELIETIAAVFTLVPQPDRTWEQRLIESLGTRELLLVLDNCEHVLDEAARVTEAVLAKCPHVTILATSREALGVRGESMFPVPSLDVGEQSAAVALFVERARDVAPELNVDDDADVVSEICRRLDGIPLAIELAAARVRSMNPTQIRDRLDERFRLLTGARRSFERHQTLRHAVQWSYDLLNDTEKRVLEQAAVFAGGFTLDAATALCAAHPDANLDDLEVLNVLDSLVRKSLLQIERKDEIRYSFLETIRQFAEERLAEAGEAEALRRRHASYFSDRAEAMFELFRGPQAALTYAFVDDEIANLRAAFRWAVDHDEADIAIRIAASSHQAARMRLRTETFGWAAEVADTARRLEHPKLPLVLTMACDSAWGLGLLEEAKRYGEEAIRVADDPRFESFVWAYSDLAQIALFEGDVARSLELVRAGAAHPADVRDRANLGGWLTVAGTVGQPLPDDEARQALKTVRDAGFPMGVAFALSGRAASIADNDITAAIDLCQEAIDLMHACGDRLVEQAMRAVLISLLARTDDVARALASLVETVNAWGINGDTFLASGMGTLVVLLARLGYCDGATRLYGAVTRSIALDALVPELDAAMRAARDEMGSDAFIAARAAGAALSYQAAADLACELIDRARADVIAAT